MCSAHLNSVQSVRSSVPKAILLPRFYSLNRLACGWVCFAIGLAMVLATTIEFQEWTIRIANRLFYCSTFQYSPEEGQVNICTPLGLWGYRLLFSAVGGLGSVWFCISECARVDHHHPPTTTSTPVIASSPKFDFLWFPPVVYVSLCHW